MMDEYRRIRHKELTDCDGEPACPIVAMGLTDCNLRALLCAPWGPLARAADNPGGYELRLALEAVTTNGKIPEAEPGPTLREPTSQEER